jgi:hypothetical protein
MAQYWRRILAVSRAQHRNCAVSESHRQESATSDRATVSVPESAARVRPAASIADWPVTVIVPASAASVRAAVCEIGRDITELSGT